MPNASGSSRRRSRSRAKAPGERLPRASMMAAPDTTKISGMRQRFTNRMPSRSQSMLSMLVRCQLQPDQAMPAW
jgi:hypothetical protein